MNKELSEIAKYFDWAGLIIAALFFALGYVHGGFDQPKPEPCPVCDAQPFCQVMGSPVGGRMAQLPEGVGPRD